MARGSTETPLIQTPKKRNRQINELLKVSGLQSRPRRWNKPAKKWRAFKMHMTLSTLIERKKSRKSFLFRKEKIPFHLGCGSFDEQNHGIKIRINSPYPSDLVFSDFFLIWNLKIAWRTTFYVEPQTTPKQMHILRRFRNLIMWQA